VVLALLTKAPEMSSSPSLTSLPQPSPFGRRKLLTNTLSGVLTTRAMASAKKANAKTTVPAVVSVPVSSTTTVAIAQQVPQAGAPKKEKDENNPLLSLESAASKLFDGDDPFADRLNYPHPGLRRTASPVTSFGSDLETIADGLVKIMESNATTAVQYGIDARIIVLRGAASPSTSNGNSNSPKPASGSPIVFVNPNILSRSSEDKMVQWREYCLVVGENIVWPEGEPPSASTPLSSLSRGSNPQRLLVEVDLLRDAVVEVAAQDLTGKPIRMALQGEAARAFQHELDHLDGILIVDHASLEDLPPGIAFLEEPFHFARQKKAFARATYLGNGPLYY
jgi:peptide deformylase